MLTKVGRSRTMLICSDCGHPQAPATADQGLGWPQLATVLVVLVMTGLPVALVVLSERVRLNDSPLNRPANPEGRP
jgi:hypothetical protein